MVERESVARKSLARTDLCWIKIHRVASHYWRVTDTSIDMYDEQMAEMADVHDT